MSGIQLAVFNHAHTRPWNRAHVHSDHVHHAAVPLERLPGAPPPIPRQLLICFLSPWMFAFSRILYKRVHTFVCLASFIRHNYLEILSCYTCINSSLIAEKNSIVWIYQFIRFWCIFWLFPVFLTITIKLLEHARQVFAWTCISISLGVELLGHMAGRCQRNCFRNHRGVFRRGCTIYSPPTSELESRLLRILATLGMMNF